PGGVGPERVVGRRYGVAVFNLLGFPVDTYPGGPLAPTIVVGVHLGWGMCRLRMRSVQWGAVAWSPAAHHWEQRCPAHPPSRPTTSPLGRDSDPRRGRKASDSRSIRSGGRGIGAKT